MTDIHFAGSDFVLCAEDVSPALLDALKDCGASGDASDVVAYVLSQFEITGDVETCRGYLKGYGAWGDEELADHEANLQRLVWLAGSSLREENEAYFSAY